MSTRTVTIYVDSQAFPDCGLAWSENDGADYIMSGAYGPMTTQAEAIEALDAIQSDADLDDTLDYDVDATGHALIITGPADHPIFAEAQ